MQISNFTLIPDLFCCSCPGGSCRLCVQLDCFHLCNHFTGTLQLGTSQYSRNQAQLQGGVAVALLHWRETTDWNCRRTWWASGQPSVRAGISLDLELLESESVWWDSSPETPHQAFAKACYFDCSLLLNHYLLVSKTNKTKNNNNTSKICWLFFII